jgi:ligand-binding sensor domain-containing protein
MKSGVFISICCLFVNFIHAQKYPLRTIDFDDGLLKPGIYKIVKDKKGFMWFASDPKVIRFDGTEFISYGSDNGLKGLFSFDMGFDRTGNLYIATYGNGIARFDGAKFHAFNTKNGFPADYIRKLLFTSSNELWVASVDSGVIRVRQDMGPEILSLSPGKYFKTVWDVIETRSGNIVSASADGIYLFRKPYDNYPKCLFHGNYVMTSVAEDSLGNIWAGGFKTLVYITADSTFDYSGKVPDGAFVLSMMMHSSDGSLFISTDKGLVIRKHNEWSLLGRKNGIIDQYFWDAYEDESGDVWLATNNSGVIKYDKKGIDIFDSELIGNNHGVICNITGDHEGNLYVGTEGNGIFIHTDTAFAKIVDGELKNLRNAYHVYTDPLYGEVMTTDSRGYIFWMKDNKIKRTLKLPLINIAAGALRLDSNRLLILAYTDCFIFNLNSNSCIRIDALPNDFFRASCLDERNNLWISSDDGNVYQWDGSKVVHHGQINPEGYLISQIYYDRLTHFYFFCSSGGLIVWNGTERLLFNTSHGLKSDVIQCITRDQQNRLWIGHEFGVSCIDLSNKRYFDLGYDQGFTTVATNSSSMYCDHKGDIWVGTGNSVVRIHPEQVIPRNKHTRLLIHQVYAQENIFYKENYFSTLPEKIITSHRKNNLTVKFSALDFNNAKDVQYRWKLKGFDEDFIPYTFAKEANYTNLFPGDYEFIVQALDSDGYETETVSFKLIVLKPFWEKAWFYGLEILIFTLLLFLSFLFSSKTSDNRLGQIITVLTIIVSFESFIFFLSGYINPFTNGIPVFQLAMNIILAVVLQPLERILKKKMKTVSVWGMRGLKNKIKK